MKDQRPLVLLGSGGHAKVAMSLAIANGRTVSGMCTLDPAAGAIWRGIPVLGGDEMLDGLDTSRCLLLNGVGMLPAQSQRRQLFERLARNGFVFATLYHPSAWVDPTAILGQGVQVMAGCIIQADASIGENTLINTGSLVDHDCVIGAHVHIAPGATLCGNVRIGDGAFVGSGATIIHGISVGTGAIVGAGVTVTRDLPKGAVAIQTARTGPLRSGDKGTK